MKVLYIDKKNGAPSLKPDLLFNYFPLLNLTKKICKLFFDSEATLELLGYWPLGPLLIRPYLAKF